MTSGNRERFAGDPPVQFAKRDDTACKGNTTNEHTEENFNLMNPFLHPRLFDVNWRHGDVGRVQLITEAYEHSSQTHETMQDGHQLGHRGHLNSMGDKDTNACPDHDRGPDCR